MKLSASQIQIYTDCKRKWAWRYLEKLRPPPHPTAALGSRVHEILELWGREGTAPDLAEVFVTLDGRKHRPGRIAACGLGEIPRPEENETEKKIEIDFGWATFVGYIDSYAPGVVYDYKTTSDFRWAKTEQDLKNDIQAAIYAAYALNDREFVQLHWVYFRTRGAPKTKTVSVSYTKKDLKKNLERIKPIALEILERYKENPSAISLEPNTDQCDAYGGCPYRNNCGLTPTERLKGKMTQQTLREKMRAKLAAQKAAQVEINPPETKAPSPAPSSAPSSAKSGYTLYTLYIDCYPMSSTPTNAAEILAKGVAEVSAEMELAHYRLADYAKGPAALCVWLKAHLEKNEYNEIFVDSRSAEARDTLTVFESRAASVIRRVS